MDVDFLRKTMKQEFTTFDIAKILGIKRNCIQPWIDGSFIVPSIQKSTRRGTKNIFSREDLYRIRLFQQLLDSGISRGEASIYAKGINFRNVGPGKNDFKYEVYYRRKMKEGKDSGIFTDMNLEKEEPKIILGDKYSYAFVVNLLLIKEEVDKLVD